MLKNLGQALAEVLEVRSEAELHPHCPAERAELFRTTAQGAAEIEVLNFLNALVFLTKPGRLLETGTGSGLTTAAIGSAMQANGFGHLDTIEAVPEVSRAARDLVARLDTGLLPQITFHVTTSLDWIADCSGPPFDFAFFDSIIPLRYLEYVQLRERGMLTRGGVCVFHDTSRLRGDTMPDYEPGVIEALDQAGSGGQWFEFYLSRGLRVLRAP